MSAVSQQPSINIKEGDASAKQGHDHIRNSPSDIIAAGDGGVDSSSRSSLIPSKHCERSDFPGYPVAGSSQNSADNQLKGMDAPVDVESQGPARPKRQRGSCQTWCGEIDFDKWYEWSAYYIPILEWLPQYKRMSHYERDKLIVVSYILRDLFAGLTLASISIPMSLSYAAYVLFTLVMTLGI